MPTLNGTHTPHFSEMDVILSFASTNQVVSPAEADRLDVLQMNSHFGVWSGRISDKLRSTGYGQFAYGATQERSSQKAHIDIIAMRARLYIMAHVCPSLRDKLPLRPEHEIQELWQDLKRIIVFRFLDLPAELKNRIYKMCLKQTKAFVVTKHRPHHESLKASAFPSLLHCNRQIRAEATPYFYEHNKFFMAVEQQPFREARSKAISPMARDLKLWFKDVVGANTKYLRNFYITVWKAKSMRINDKGDRHLFNLKINDAGEFEIEYPLHLSASSKEVFQERLHDINEVYGPKYKGKTLKEAVKRCTSLLEDEKLVFC